MRWDKFEFGVESGIAVKTFVFTNNGKHVQK
jgi:hypothetical protein